MILGLVYGYIPFMILPLFGSLDRIHAEPARGRARPGRQRRSRRSGASRCRCRSPAILAGLVIVSLPMFGDYYTNNLLGIDRTRRCSAT